MSKIIDKLHELTRKLDDIATPETSMRMVENVYLLRGLYPQVDTLVSADCPYCKQRVFVSKGVAAVVRNYLSIEDKRHTIFIVSDVCPICKKTFSIHLDNASTITTKTIDSNSTNTYGVISGKIISGS